MERKFVPWFDSGTRNEICVSLVYSENGNKISFTFPLYTRGTQISFLVPGSIFRASLVPKLSAKSFSDRKFLKKQKVIKYLSLNDFCVSSKHWARLGSNLSADWRIFFFAFLIFKYYFFIIWEYFLILPKNLEMPSTGTPKIPRFKIIFSMCECLKLQLKFQSKTVPLIQSNYSCWAMLRKEKSQWLEKA